MSAPQINHFEPKRMSILADHFTAVRLESAQYSQHGVQLFYKRLVDVVLALTALITLSPLLAFISVLIKLDSRGPVLYSGRRIGKDGRMFGCLKFRTMATNASELLQDHLSRDKAAAAEWSRTQKLKSDPRVSRLGHILRTTSLDELPQLWNVLVGEMSIVGPRPIVNAEVPKYGDVFALYMSVLPGITGLWQVSGRSDTTYDQRVRLDAQYVTEWNVITDLRIIVKTIPAVLNGRGAY